MWMSQMILVFIYIVTLHQPVLALRLNDCECRIELIKADSGSFEALTTLQRTSPNIRYNLRYRRGFRVIARSYGNCIWRLFRR